MEKIGSSFRGKLGKMIKDAGSKFNDYSILPKIRQILLHWGYELTEKDFFINSANKCIKMSHYWFDRQEVLQKAKERYSKQKLLIFIYKTKKQQNKSQKSDTKTCQKMNKNKIKEYQRKRYQQLIQ